MTKTVIAILVAGVALIVLAISTYNYNASRPSVPATPTRASVLTINDGCSVGNPCWINDWAHPYVSSSIASITAGSATGLAKVYAFGKVIVVEYPASDLRIDCTNCLALSVTEPSFPTGATPLYDAYIIGGAWGSVDDLRVQVPGTKHPSTSTIHPQKENTR